MKESKTNLPTKLKIPTNSKPRGPAKMTKTISCFGAKYNLEDLSPNMAESLCSTIRNKNTRKSVISKQHVSYVLRLYEYVKLSTHCNIDILKLNKFHIVGLLS